MPVTFRFQEIPSRVFGRIYRPVATVGFNHKTKPVWVSIEMIIDTGADYSILPRTYADALGIDLLRDCSTHRTLGIGGTERIFLYHGQAARLGNYARKIPIGFLDRESGPALLGRHEFLETFKVVFVDHTTQFMNPGARERAPR